MRRGLAVLLLLACATAAAQTLYRWTDADGRVQYGDRPPKDFKGSVTRLDPPPPVPAPGKPVAAATPAAVAKPAATAEDAPRDMAAKRRSERERLQKALDDARAGVAEARKALDEGRNPQVDERQAIQQRVTTQGNSGAPQSLPNRDATQNRPVAGGMHGMATRSNCRTAKGADGKDVTICPTMVLKEEYFDRVAKLEEALRLAEEALAEAESNYRRGVD